MKILHIINSLETGGAEKLLIETLPLYVERGFHVDLLLLNGVDHPFFKELASTDCCQIFSLGNDVVYNPINIFRIIPYLKNYDVVHVHLFPTQYFVVLAKLISGANIKLILTVHSTSNKRMCSPILRKLDRYFYRSYTKIIAISESVKDALVEHLGSSDKITVIKNGVDIAKVNLTSVIFDRNLLFPEENMKILVQVSGFRLEKDQDTAIRSLLYLPTSYHLLLVGDGERKKKLADLVSHHGLQNRVHFLGVRNDVFSILKSVDVVVVSSHWEGFGLVAVEAMAANKPVVASDVPGLREIVEGAGILFDQGDEKALAEEILHLSNDTEHYNATVEKCMVRAKHYDISKMVAEHVDLYKEILKVQE